MILQELECGIVWSFLRESKMNTKKESSTRTSSERRKFAYKVRASRRGRPALIPRRKNPANSPGWVSQWPSLESELKFVTYKVLFLPGYFHKFLEKLLQCGIILNIYKWRESGHLQNNDRFRTYDLISHFEWWRYSTKQGMTQPCRRKIECEDYCCLRVHVEHRGHLQQSYYHSNPLQIRRIQESSENQKMQYCRKYSRQSL